MEPNQEQNQPISEAEVVNNNSPETTESPAQAAPKALDLLKAGWEFAKARRDLYLWYVFSLAVVAVFSSEALMDKEGIVGLIAVLGFFVAMIFVALNAWSIIYTVSQPDSTALTYKQTFGWSSSNFFPLLWTSILSGLAAMLGFMLLIIPGLIVSVYFYFALYAQAHGAKGGKEAIMRSYHDVKGRWWTVAKKLIGIGLYLLLVYLVVGIVYAILTGITGESAVGFLIADVLMQGVVGGVISVVTIHAIGHYYKYLRANPLAQSAEVPKPTPETE